MGKSNLGCSFELLYLMSCFSCYFFNWAHPICVFGDDHVTCYVGADVDVGERVDG